MEEAENPDNHPQKDVVKRRDFMRTTILGIGGLISAGFGIPAVAYIVGPALQQETGKWLELGSVNKV